MATEKQISMETENILLTKQMVTENCYGSDVNDKDALFYANLELYKQSLKNKIN